MTLDFRTVGWMILVPLLMGIGPCGRLPGGSLLGEDESTAVTDWSFTNAVGLCALEVNPAGPHSVTLNCMSWADRLFVSCSQCDGKTWSAYALHDDQGRIEIGSRIYPVNVRRVTDADLLDKAWAARATKLGSESRARPEHWWSFELTSR